MTAFQVVKKFLIIIWNPKVQYFLHKIASILISSNPDHLKCTGVFSPASRSPNYSLTFKYLLYNYIANTHFSRGCYIHVTSYPRWFNRSDDKCICWRLQIMKLLIVQFPSFFCYFSSFILPVFSSSLSLSLLGSDILKSTLFTNTEIVPKTRPSSRLCVIFRKYLNGGESFVRN
jgi:hypothetical protein